MSPQILTETLWALTQQQTPAFLPSEIHLVTTRSGGLNAERNLLDSASGHYYALCADYGLPSAAFGAERIHIITDADGQPLDDIRTLSETEAAADFITRQISEFTADPNCALREDVPQRLLDGRAGFSETIRRAQRIHEPPRLRVDLRERQVVADELSLSLPPVEFGFYVWMVWRQLAGSMAEAVSVRELAEPNRRYAAEFLALRQRIEGEMGRDLERTEQALRDGMDRSFFDEKKSRVRSALTDQLGRAIAERYDIRSIGKRGSTEYLIPLEPEQIEWIEWIE